MSSGSPYVCSAQRRVCTACTCARHLQRVARAMLLPRHAAGCVRVGWSCRARCERSRVAAKMSCRLRRHCSPTGPKRVQRKFVTRKEQTLSYSHGFRIARSKPRLRQCAADAWRCQPSARRVELHSRRSRTREPPNWSETGARLVGISDHGGTGAAAHAASARVARRPIAMTSVHETRGTSRKLARTRQVTKLTK